MTRCIDKWRLWAGGNTPDDAQRTRQQKNKSGVATRTNARPLHTGKRSSQYWRRRWRRGTSLCLCNGTRKTQRRTHYLTWRRSQNKKVPRAMFNHWVFTTAVADLLQWDELFSVSRGPPRKYFNKYFSWYFCWSSSRFPYLEPPSPPSLPPVFTYLDLQVVRRSFPLVFSSNLSLLHQKKFFPYLLVDLSLHMIL